MHHQVGPVDEQKPVVIGGGVQQKERVEGQPAD
jgi:hypothetical protein